MCTRLAQVSAGQAEVPQGVPEPTGVSAHSLVPSQARPMQVSEVQVIGVPAQVFPLQASS
jgi:hypothetical protein